MEVSRQGETFIEKEIKLLVAEKTNVMVFYFTSTLFYE